MDEQLSETKTGERGIQTNLRTLSLSLSTDAAWLVECFQIFPFLILQLSSIIGILY